MKILILLISFFLISSQSFAGIYTKWQISNYDKKKKQKPSLVEMYFVKNKLRVEGTTNGKKKVMIFRLDKNETWILDPKNKTYQIRKKKKSTQTDQKNEELKNKMQNKLQKLFNKVPNKHKSKVEGYVSKIGGEGLLPPTKLKFTQIGNDIKIKGATVNFDKYEAKVKDKTVKLIYTLDFKDAEMTQGDMQILYEVSNFVGNALNEISDVSFRNDFAQEKGKYKGFPAISYYYDKNGQPKFGRNLLQIENEKIEEKLFNIPKGFKKKR